MAVAFVRNHTAVATLTAGADNLGLNISTATTAGNLLVAFILFDTAAGVAEPSVTNIAKAAGETNSWQLQARAKGTADLAAGEYAFAEMYAIETTVAWPVASYTVTLSVPVNMKATGVQEFSGAYATSESGVGRDYRTDATASSASTYGTLPAIGDLAVGFLFHSNTSSPPTGDTDTTGGAWSTPYPVVSSGGGSGSDNNAGLAQYKILTTASHQTFNRSGGGTPGNGSIVAILQQQAAGALTHAATDTEALTDTVGKASTAARSDILTPTDTVSTALAAARSYPDMLALTDAVSTVVTPGGTTHTRSATDLLWLTDAVTTGLLGTVGGAGPVERMLAETPPANLAGGGWTVGAKFTVVAAGEITHIRYYAAAATVFALTVWNPTTQAKLATATDNAPGVGWREVSLPSPLSVQAAASYIVSYSGAGFAYDSPIPTSLAPNLTNLTPSYDAGSDVFPLYTGAYNYHVDVLFQTTSGAGQTTFDGRDGLPLTDTVSTVLVGGGTTHTKDLSDTLALTDTAARTVELARSDALPLTDAVATATTLDRAYSDTLGLTDATTGSDVYTDIYGDPYELGVDRARGYSDTEALTDSAARAVDLARTDAEGLTDTASVTVTLDRTDSLPLTDAATRTVSPDRTDALAVTDAATRTVSLDRTDGVGLVDGATTSGSGAATYSDNVPVTDTVALVVSLNRADTEALTDTVAIGGEIARTYTDTEALTDAVSASITLSRSYADTEALTDARVLSAQPDRTDAEALTDSVLTVASTVRAYADTIGLTDSATITLVYARAYADVLPVTDTVAVSLALARDYTDTLTLTDSVTLSVIGAVYGYAGAYGVRGPQVTQSATLRPAARTEPARPLAGAVSGAGTPRVTATARPSTVRGTS